MTTESRDEREAPDQLKDIRRARELGILPWSHLSNPTQSFEVACDTLDFLLSLLDSQAQTARELALIVDVGTGDDPGTAITKIRKLSLTPPLGCVMRVRERCG